jgi:cytochrome c oxidase cbb3-type subunit 1
MLYYLVPVLWNRQRVYSERLIAWHFWIATLGIVLYITAMWVSGIMQGLMWRAYDDLGFLQYSFVETVAAMHPYYVIRVMGGLMYLTGAILMAWNVWKTITESEAEQPVRAEAPVGARAVPAE